MSSATWNLVLLFVLYYVMYDLSTIVTTTFTAKMETAKAQIVVMIDPFVRIPLILFHLLQPPVGLPGLRLCASFDSGPGGQPDPS